MKGFLILFSPILFACWYWYVAVTPWFCPNFGCCLDSTKCTKIKARGYFDPKYQPVLDVMEDSLTKGWDIGSSVYVEVDGETVVDVVGGYIDEQRKIPMEKDTVNLFMSNGKFFENFGLAVLEEKGLLDIEAPIATYWPEFAQQGKENITLQDILAHRSGEGGVFETKPTLEIFQDNNKRDTFLAEQKFNYQKGDVYYRGWTSALYSDAVSRRVDPKGRHLHQLVQDEIFEPIGESLICPPIDKLSEEEKSRVTPVFTAPVSALVFGIFPQLLLPNSFARLAALNKRMTLDEYDNHLFRTVLFRLDTNHPTRKPTIPSQPRDAKAYNDPTGFLSYPMLSGNCMSNARCGSRAFASFFDSDILSKEVRDKFLRPLPEAYDRFIMRYFNHTASGLALDLFPNMPPETKCVGWFGIGGSTIQRCYIRNHTVTYAYIPNVLSPVPHEDRTILAAIADVLLSDEKQ